MSLLRIDKSGIELYRAVSVEKYFCLQRQRTCMVACLSCSKKPPDEDTPGWWFIQIATPGYPNYTYNTICPDHWPKFRAVFMRALLEAEI